MLGIDNAKGVRVKKLLVGTFTSRVLYRWEDLLSTILKFHDDFYFHKAAGTYPWYRPCMKPLAQSPGQSPDRCSTWDRKVPDRGRKMES